MDRFEATVMVCGGLLIAGLLFGTCASVEAGEKEHARLVNQCITSGKQEWECHAALDVKTTTVAVPVVVQGGH